MKRQNPEKDRRGNSAALQSALQQLPQGDSRVVDWDGLGRRVFRRLDSSPHGIMAWREALTIPRAVMAVAVLVLLCGSLYVWVGQDLFLPRGRGRLIEVWGEVHTLSSRTSPDTAELALRPAREGEVLREGSVFSTEAGSFMVAQLGDSTRLALSDHSVIRVDREQPANARFLLEKGSVSVRLTRRKKGSDFAVVTPNAVCRALGTVFRVSILGRPDSIVTELSVLKGRVRIASRAAPQTARIVQTGEVAYVTGGHINDPVSLIRSSVVAEMSRLLHLEMHRSDRTPTGLLRITSDPPGASVYIDDSLSGSTPCEVRTDTGYHSVTVQTATYPRWSGPVYVTARKTQDLAIGLKSLAQNDQDTAAATTEQATVITLVSAAQNADTTTKPGPHTPSRKAPGKDTVPVSRHDINAPVSRMRARLLNSPEPAATITGSGGREEISIGVLDLPSGTSRSLWLEDALSHTIQYVQKKTSFSLRHNIPRFSMSGPYRSFRHWLRQVRTRSLPVEEPHITRSAAEQDALNALVGAGSFFDEKRWFEGQVRVRAIVEAYIQVRFGISLSLSDTLWSKKLVDSRAKCQWFASEVEILHKGLIPLLNAPHPDPADMAPLYHFLRLVHLMRFPLLFCDPAGVPRGLSQENRILLSRYLDEGGCIYFCNTFEPDECNALRALMQELIGETLHDSLSRKIARRFQQDDRSFGGFRFEQPRPNIFHPCTWFPFVLPREATITFSIRDTSGDTLFSHTLDRQARGSYVNRKNAWYWDGRGKNGSLLSSGLYVYTAEAGLARRTYPVRISRIRKLHTGQDPLFSACFTLSDLPVMCSMSPRLLPFEMRGVFGVKGGDRLSLLYTEGYCEAGAFGEVEEAREARVRTLQWFANVVAYVLTRNERELF